MARAIPLRGWAYFPRIRNAVAGRSAPSPHRIVAWPPIAAVWQRTLLIFGTRSVPLLACILILTFIQTMDDFARMAFTPEIRSWGRPICQLYQQTEFIAWLHGFEWFRLVSTTCLLDSAETVAQVGKSAGSLVGVPLVCGLVVWIGLGAGGAGHANWFQGFKRVLPCGLALVGCWLIGLFCVTLVIAKLGPPPIVRPAVDTASPSSVWPTLYSQAVGMKTLYGTYRRLTPAISHELVRLLPLPQSLPLPTFSEMPQSICASELCNPATSLSCAGRLPAELYQLCNTDYDPNDAAQSMAIAIALGLLIQTITCFGMVSIAWAGAASEHGTRRSLPFMQMLADLLFGLRHLPVAMMHLGLVQLFIVAATVLFLGVPEAMAPSAWVISMLHVPSSEQTTALVSTTATSFASSFFLLVVLLYASQLYATLRRSDVRCDQTQPLTSSGRNCACAQPGTGGRPGRLSLTRSTLQVTLPPATPCPD